MQTAFDIIAIGSGHNGLVAAAYLAAAGKRVLVLERNPWFGGGVVTRELTVPGFRHDQHSMAHIFIQANPLLRNDELRLKEKFGLKYVFPELPMMSVFEDGKTLGVYRDRERTCAEIAKFSRKDADAFRRVVDADSENRDAILALDRLYQQAEKWPELVEILRREIRLAGDDNEIICPYCSTLYRYDAALSSHAARPPECALPLAVDA